MSVLLPSFAKINLGLRIGSLRADGFHELRTVYQTIALHDMVSVSVNRGSGIEIRCSDPRVPTDSTNTCWRIIHLAMQALNARGRVVIEIEKRLPVQGGLGGASGNAATALLALERALRKNLPLAERLRIAAEVGSDIPLFLIGGTVLGVGRGEEVHPLPDLPSMPCVIALPEVAISTPKAFADWDELCGAGAHAHEKSGPSNTVNMYEKEDTETVAKFGPLRKDRVYSRTRASRNDGALAPEGSGEQSSARTGEGARPHMATASYIANAPNMVDAKLTPSAPSDRMLKFSREISAWLNAVPSTGSRRSGVSASGGGRAESPLLDLVRTGIENDFEKVVFPKYPELLEVRRVLERSGAEYASLSGSGSAIYGLFVSKAQAASAVAKLSRMGTKATVTSTLTRRQYWQKL